MCVSVIQGIKARSLKKIKTLVRLTSVSVWPKTKLCCNVISMTHRPKLRFSPCWRSHTLSVTVLFLFGLYSATKLNSCSMCRLRLKWKFHMSSCFLWYQTDIPQVVGRKKKLKSKESISDWGISVPQFVIRWHCEDAWSGFQFIWSGSSAFVYRPPSLKLLCNQIIKNINWCICCYTRYMYSNHRCGQFS